MGIIYLLTVWASAVYCFGGSFGSHDSYVLLLMLFLTFWFPLFILSEMGFLRRIGMFPELDNYGGRGWKEFYARKEDDRYIWQSAFKKIKSSFSKLQKKPLRVEVRRQKHWDNMESIREDQEACKWYYDTLEVALSQDPDLSIEDIEPKKLQLGPKITDVSSGII